MPKKKQSGGSRSYRSENRGLSLDWFLDMDLEIGDEEENEESDSDE